MRWAVLLAGGSGTRFWPLSTRTRPKQVLRLAGDVSPAEEAVARLDGLIDRDRLLLVTGRDLVDALREQLGLSAANVLVEPRARSTGPALVWASFEARRRDPDAVVLSLHADWHVPDPAAFRRVAATALEVAAREAALVTVGVVPTRPETGYGYILPGESCGDGARRVRQFVEKPNAGAAAALLREGAVWNSGLFAWRAQVLLDEVRAATPEIARALPRLEQSDVRGFFEETAEISIDVGVLERSPRVLVVRGDFAWDDIGTWEALARVRPADEHGNVAAGPVTAIDAERNIAWTDGAPIVLVGVTDLVVVHANGRILVMDRARAADLKRVLERLPPDVRDG